MGYMRHHALIVTSWDEGYIEEAHTVALDVFGEDAAAQVTGITNPMNGLRSFCIVPDGGKESMDESEIGEEHRVEMVGILDIMREGGRFCDYALVQFADENGNECLLRTQSGNLACAYIW